MVAAPRPRRYDPRYTNTIDSIKRKIRQASMTRVKSRPILQWPVSMPCQYAKQLPEPGSVFGAHDRVESVRRDNQKVRNMRR